MSDETMWAAPEDLAAGHIGPDLGPGLFRATRDEGEPILFWIVDVGGKLFSVMLPNKRYSQKYDLWELGEPVRGWFGVHLGEVTLLLDSDRIEERVELPRPGDIEIAGGVARLVCTLPRSFPEGRQRLEVGRLRADTSEGFDLAVRHWALAKQEPDGDLIILYENGAEPNS